jgi:membrane protein
MPVAMKKLLRTIRRAFVSAISGFSDDELMTRAAALAFYSALSLAPLLILLMWVLSLLHSEWENDLNNALTGILGTGAADALARVVDDAKSRPHVGNVAGIIGLGVMLFTATAVFAQLRGTLNRVWRVKPRPGAAISAWLRTRAYAFAVLVGTGFMLIISFAISGMIHVLIPRQLVAWEVSEYVASVIVFTLVFGAMYKMLPDAHIDWSDALSGAIVTAVMFVIGEYAIGLYIGHSRAETTYGPAGAFVVVLTWVYYSSVIVLIGAELTRALADARGKPVRPDPHVMEIDGPHGSTPHAGPSPP